MTRKDYIAIARALNNAKPEGPLAAFRQHTQDCNAVADALQRDNERFDRDRFLTACGVV